MNSINPHLVPVAVVLMLCTIISVKGSPAGLEFKAFKLCGPSAKSVKIKISPWPFIPSGSPFHVTVAFTPAEDIFAVTSEYTLMTEPDGRVFSRGRDDLCHQLPELCSLPAGEKFVWKYSDIMRAFPPGFKLTFRGEVKLFNEESTEFLCLQFVAKIH